MPVHWTSFIFVFHYRKNRSLIWWPWHAYDNWNRFCFDLWHFCFRILFPSAMWSISKWKALIGETLLICELGRRLRFWRFRRSKFFACVYGLVNFELMCMIYLSALLKRARKTNFHHRTEKNHLVDAMNKKKLFVH